MTTLYKLTDANGKTRAGKHNETQWGENVTHTATADGGTRLCTSDVIHAYEHPLVAVFMNPAHANFRDPMLWEATGEVVVRDGQTKCGVKTLTTLRQIPLPVLTTEQRVHIAIRCALAVYTKPSFVAWARAWLDRTDRTRKSASDAAADTYAAYSAVAARAAVAAASAARAASYSADTYAAAAADAASVASAYATAAYADAIRCCDLDLVAIIEMAQCEEGE